jgi:hypothetical protein
MFEGRVVAGISSGIGVGEFAGQDVVIAGFGAPSVEDARRALQGGTRRDYHNFVTSVR